MGKAPGHQFLFLVPLTFALFCNYSTQPSWGFKDSWGIVFREEEVIAGVFSFLARLKQIKIKDVNKRYRKFYAQFLILKYKWWLWTNVGQ